jgi:pentapeptide MXKDX repeat protein
MDSEEIQVLSEEQIDRFSISNGKIKPANNPIIPVQTCTLDQKDSKKEKNIMSTENLSLEIFSKDILSKDFLSNDSLSKDILSQYILSKDSLSKDSLSKDSLSKDVLYIRAEEEKTKAQLTAATRSMITNGILGATFLFLWITIIFIPDFWRPYFFVILFSVMRGSMPLMTAIANFGTVKSVALQYLGFFQQVFNKMKLGF